jgi:hypothetical protein
MAGSPETEDFSLWDWSKEAVVPSPSQFARVAGVLFTVLVPTKW